jgi:hypothetical protein
MSRLLAAIILLAFAFLDPASGAGSKQKPGTHPQQQSAQSTPSKPKSTLKAGKLQMENQKIDHMKEDAR